MLIDLNHSTYSNENREQGEDKDKTYIDNQSFLK